MTILIYVFNDNYDVMAEMQRLFYKTNSNCKKRSRP